MKNIVPDALLRLKVVLKLVSLSVTLYLLKMPLTRENKERELLNKICIVSMLAPFTSDAKRMYTMS